MDIKIETGAAHERKLKVQVPWTELAPEYEKKLNELNKKVKRPGFRPGKIPRQIMTKTYGPSVLADLVEDMAQKAFFQSVIENHWEPLSQGSLEDMGHFEEGSDLTFDLSLEVEPEVELAKYKNGYKLTKPIYTPTDEDVEHALGHLQERFAEVKPQEAGAADGDLIKGDLQYLDASGVAIVGSRVEDRYIKVGEGVFGGEVAKSLLNAKTGDEIRFDVPSPEKGEEDLHIQMTVKSVETHTLPELNDEFAKQVNPELENLDALKAEVLEDIQKQLDGEARRAYNQGIAQHMVDGAKVEIPEIMITNYLDRLVERYKEEQGPDFNEAELRESNRDRAIWELKWYLIRKRVVREEGLEATDADVDARIDELTADMPGDASKIKALYKDKQYLPQIKEDILDQKVFTHLESFAKVKEKKVSSKEIGGYHGRAH